MCYHTSSLLIHIGDRNDKINSGKLINSCNARKNIGLLVKDTELEILMITDIQGRYSVHYDIHIEVIF